MTIETKYDIGDDVWIMQRNKPVRVEVRDIEISRFQNDGMVVIRNRIVYHMVGDSANTGYHEEELYPTKEALIQSL